MMMKECQSVVSDGADHPELRASLDKYVAAVVPGLLDCYVVSEGGAEIGSLSIIFFNNFAWQQICFQSCGKRLAIMHAYVMHILSRCVFNSCFDEVTGN